MATGRFLISEEGAGGIKSAKPKPTEKDFRNLPTILINIEKLRCDMYDNLLISVPLVNKLVSLANHPSTRILQNFTLDAWRATSLCCVLGSEMNSLFDFTLGAMGESTPKGLPPQVQGRTPGPRTPAR